jgi:hypothetical protein
MSTQILGEKACASLDKWKNLRQREGSLRAELISVRAEIVRVVNDFGDHMAPPDMGLGEVITIPIGGDFLVLGKRGQLDEERYMIRWRGEKSNAAD